jgi:PKD repeat protein
MDSAVGKYYCDFLADVGSGTYCNGGNAASNAFFPALGNHDYSDGGGINEYLSYFTLPGAGVSTSGASGSEKYYDFVKGPVHFFVVNSVETATFSTQKAWLQQQLSASTSPWQVVYFHHAPYSSASHGSDPDLQWPFASWGADAVFSAHDHTYERLEIDGIPYLVNGLGGKSRYTFNTPIAGSVVRYRDNYGAMLMDATDTAMTFQFINVAGTLIDTHTITQENSGNSGILNIRVSQSSDDAEELTDTSPVQGYATGHMTLTSTDLEMVDDSGWHGGDQTVGVRFQNVDVPQGATILAAYLEFATDEAGSAGTTIDIRAQDSDDAATFTTTTYNISSRPTTSASASWTIPGWSTIGKLRTTPDLTDVVQEVVDRAGWAANNSMAFIITGSGDRTAEAYDGDPGLAPLLHVEYNTSANALGIHEAEDAFLSGPVIASNFAGYSGNGFAEYINATGDYVEWTVNATNADQYALRFRYALASGDRPLQISVNGQVIATNLSFPATGSFATWGMTADVVMTLAEGANTIRATAAGSSGANVDYLEIAAYTIPNQAPTAGFTHSEVDLTANFTDISTDSDGTIANWSWDFGDGSGSTAQNPNHSYASGGTYTVSLTVTDNDGGTDSNSASVTVTESDTTPPTITAPVDVTVEATGVTTSVSLGSPTVSDDTDPNPAVTNDAPAVFPVGATTVTWTATDASDNSAHCDRHHSTGNHGSG